MKPSKKKILLISLGSAVVLSLGLLKALISYGNEAETGNAASMIVLDDNKTYISNDGDQLEVVGSGNVGTSKDNTEYWTYDSYKEWLTNERKELDKLAQGDGKYLKDGEWVEWTEADSKELLKVYNANLKKIKEGYSLSKSSNAEEDTALMIHPLQNVATVERTSVRAVSK